MVNVKIDELLIYFFKRNLFINQELIVLIKPMNNFQVLILENINKLMIIRIFKLINCKLFKILKK